MKSETKLKKSIRGKTVVITGGSSGVGKATAEAFALEGCNIVVAARGKEALDETVSLCRDLGGYLQMFQKLKKLLILLKQPFNLTEELTFG